LSWLATRVGVHKTEEGVKFEVGETRMSSLKVGNKGKQKIKFSKGVFDGKKDVVVFVNVAGPPEAGKDEWMVSRVHKVDKKGFTVSYSTDRKKKVKKHSKKETISWLAIPTGSGVLFGGKRYAVGATKGKKVNQKWFKVKNLQKYGFTEDNTLTFAQQLSVSGQDTTAIRVQKFSGKNKSVKEMKLRLQEPTKKKNCKFDGKHKKEKVGWMLIEG